MAAARNVRQEGLVIDKIPDCPVCLEPLAAPIYSCKSGHDICGSCTDGLRSKSLYKCPICRQPMESARNEGVERTIKEARVACPNKEAGCVYTVKSMSLEDHLKECTFRLYRCPLGLTARNQNCTWQGKRTDMLKHFKDHHPSLCNINPDRDIELNNVSLRQNNSHLYLASLDKLLFVITVKVDADKRMAYLTVQHIGTKHVARQHNYKIEITSKHDSRRKVVFTEICENDTTTVDEIISQGKCGAVSLEALNHFAKDNQLAFRYYITKDAHNPNKRSDKNDARDGNDENNSGAKGERPRGSRPHSKGPDSRGSDFKGDGYNRGRGGRAGGPMKMNQAY